MVLASAILGSFGLGMFTVDPAATTLTYHQNSLTLTLEGPNLVGETLGGYFTPPEDFSPAETLGLRISLEGINPQSYFLIELYSGSELSMVGIYDGNTSEADSLPTDIVLIPVRSERKRLDNITGMQFIWLGEGQPTKLILHGVVKFSLAGQEQLRLANEAAARVTAGTPWENLAENLQAAYANIYPADAVKVGGTLALNLMSPSILTPELVSGYVKFDNRWRKPLLYHGHINSSTLLSTSGSWSGWSSTYAVVQISDPTLSADLVGTVRPIAVLSSGRFRGSYYQAAIAEGAKVQLSGTPSSFGTGYKSLTFYGGEIRVIQPE